MNKYSNMVEDFFLEKLKKHYETDVHVVHTQVSYECADDKGDIDLVFYHAAENRLLLAMLKGFVQPDTVEEVVRANESLNEGIEQVTRLQKWLRDQNAESLAKALRMPPFPFPPEVRFAVIGNGFVGSDYLVIPDQVLVADVNFLLLKRFAGRSLIQALNEYEQRLESLTTSTNADFLPLRLGEITIEVPQHSSSIHSII